jgi:hypothetical protein
LPCVLGHQTTPTTRLMTKTTHMMTAAGKKPAGFAEMSPIMAPTPTSDQMPSTPRTRKNMMPCAPPR